MDNLPASPMWASKLADELDVVLLCVEALAIRVQWILIFLLLGTLDSQSLKKLSRGRNLWGCIREKLLGGFPDASSLGIYRRYTGGSS